VVDLDITDCWRGEEDWLLKREEDGQKERMPRGEDGEDCLNTDGKGSGAGQMEQWADSGYWKDGK
jgi:hypothetical protein